MKIIIEGSKVRIKELKNYLKSYVKTKNLKISEYKIENKEVIKKIEVKDENFEKVKSLEIEISRLNSIISDLNEKKQFNKKRK